MPNPRRKRVRSPEAMRELILRCCPDALRVLSDLMCDEKMKAEIRIKAAESILDRACGKNGGAIGETKSEAPTVLRFEGALEEWSR